MRRKKKKTTHGFGRQSLPSSHCSQSWSLAVRQEVCTNFINTSQVKLYEKEQRIVVSPFQKAGLPLTASAHHVPQTCCQHTRQDWWDKAKCWHHQVEEMTHLHRCLYPRNVKKRVKKKEKAIPIKRQQNKNKNREHHRWSYNVCWVHRQRHGRRVVWGLSSSERGKRRIPVSKWERGHIKNLLICLCLRSLCLCFASVTQALSLSIYQLVSSPVSLTVALSVSVCVCLFLSMLLSFGHKVIRSLSYLLSFSIFYLFLLCVLAVIPSSYQSTIWHVRLDVDPRSSSGTSPPDT